MPKKVEAAKVTLRHPTGGFPVTVSEARAATLRKRGYTAASAPASPAALSASSKLADLQAKAAELGLSTEGTRAELFAAIEAES